MAKQPLLLGCVLCGIFVAVVLGLVCVVIYNFGDTAPNNEQTSTVKKKESPATPKDLRLDAFRQPWYIRGDFQEWQALLPLAKMSDYAYDLEPADRSIVEPFGFDKIQKIDSEFHSQVAYIASGEDVMVIVFRGTDEGEDWLTNAGLYLRQMDLGRIHSGFSTAYATLRPFILKTIDEKKPKHVWITGHSLGGALALVCAHDLTQFQNLDVSGVFTFGQPMIGDSSFVESLQERVGEKYVHFCNGTDAVPRTPPGLKHCGCLIWFRNGGVQKSTAYSQVYASAPGDEPPNEAPDPIDELPPLSPQELREFERTYDGEKVEAPMMMEASPTSAPPKSSILDRIPWKADHDMNRYLEQIESYIKK